MVGMLRVSVAWNWVNVGEVILEDNIVNTALGVDRVRVRGGSVFLFFPFSFSFIVG